MVSPFSYAILQEYAITFWTTRILTYWQVPRGGGGLGSFILCRPLNCLRKYASTPLTTRGGGGGGGFFYPLQAIELFEKICKYFFNNQGATTVVTAILRPKPIDTHSSPR